MTLKNLTLGTTALIGVGLLGGASALPAAAAEVKPGGALDITITGFLRAEAGGGQIDDLQRNPDKARGLDFRNDSEVHVLARGKSEESGLEYGATVEFEADTNQTLNTDETWIFLRGGWGELRMGDEDGAVDNSIIGGQTIAAGTGGIDGSSFVVAGIAGEGVFPTETDDSTKIRYYTPSFGGFSLGVSFTPTVETVGSGSNNGDFIANKSGPLAMEAENVTEGALVWDGDLGGVGIKASIVGQYGRLKNGAEASIADGGFGGKDWYSGVGGVALDLWGFKLAGSVGTDHVGDIEHQFATAGIGYGFGPVNTSITGAYIWDSNNDFSDAVGYDKPYNIVFSADYALAPGLVIAGDVAYFDLDQNSTSVTGDKGYAAVGRFAVTF
jgi:predicted porin